MPLIADDIVMLSRLLDELLELDPIGQSRRMAALPAEHAHLAASLGDMLASANGTDLNHRLTTLPRLQEAPEASSGDHIGPYELLREIGRGGMGHVWLARRADGMYEREVALKLPRVAAGAQWADRMARERRIGALLEHANIARLYDAGVDGQGRPYLVMECVRGQPLLLHCQAHAGDRRYLVEMMLQVCSAVAHAHQMLVIHRDIKPSNVMVDEGGRVKLLDFGIARLFERDAPAALDSAEAGHGTHTPGYAAPEQLTGGAVSTRSDVYALGAVLHDLLAGERAPRPDALDAKASKNLDADLRAIVMCCLRHDPAERYSSVERMADDLRRWLATKPVAARRWPWTHHVALFARRRRYALAASTAAGVVAISVGGLMWHQHEREQLQALRATQARSFLFNMIESVEPAAGQSARQVTALDMLRGALQQSRSAFPGQPLLRGQVLVELGLLLRRLDLIDEAEPVLRESHTLLASSTTSDDPALNIGRGQLAMLLLERGGAEPEREAASLAASTLHDCTDRSERCAKARAYAQDVLLQVAFRHKDADAALLHAGQAVAEYERGFGPNDAEVALALSNLAILKRNAGALLDGFADIDRALTIAGTSKLAATDYRDLHSRHALLLADLGRYADARIELDGLLTDSAPLKSRANQKRQLAQVLLAQGLLPAALEAASDAVETAQAARNPWETGFALQARAGAYSGLQRHVDARRDIGAALAALHQQGFGESSIEVLRARRIAASIDWRAGDRDAARAVLDALAPLYRRSGAEPVVAPVDLAQVLDFLGQDARNRNDLDRSVALHAEASGLLAASLPIGHPLRRRNAALAAVSHWLREARPDAPAPPASVGEALAAYLDTLPPASAWRRPSNSSGLDRAACIQLML